MNRLLFLFILTGCSSPKPQQNIEEVSLGVTFKDNYPELLSEWRLFKSTKDYLEPDLDVFSYNINAPLFSDYAYKARFMRLPNDSLMSYSEHESFGFPKGAVLVKHFYYPLDFKDSESQKRILETRLLIKEEDWVAIVYRWNEDQTDAERLILGEEVPVEWTDKYGKLNRINYTIPSQPQCKSCHEVNGKIVPIGPTARQLNRQDQLRRWHQNGKLDSLPKMIPKLVDYESTDENLADRARAWLDANCAHCHSREGPAKNSGLYLTSSERNPYRIGVNKPPVAAGRGSGGHKYSIVPGKPEESILLHRIESLNAGEMMPELGRKLQHKEGIELIREWISNMPNDKESEQPH